MTSRASWYSQTWGRIPRWCFRNVLRYSVRVRQCLRECLRVWEPEFLENSRSLERVGCLLGVTEVPSHETEPQFHFSETWGKWVEPSICCGKGWEGTAELADGEWHGSVGTLQFIARGGKGGHGKGRSSDSGLQIPRGSEASAWAEQWLPFLHSQTLTTGDWRQKGERVNENGRRNVTRA